MPDPRRILIIRPSALGDVCRTVPVLASLRRRYSGAVIDWLVQDSFAPAVAAHPDLDAVIPFRRSAMRGSRLLSPEGRAAFAQLRRALRARDGAAYELVIDCQGLLRSGFFAWLTGAPARVGYANAEELGWLGCNRRHHVPRDRHTVDRMLALIEAEDVPPVRDLRLYTPESDRAALDERLKHARFVLLAPTSRWEGKRWPADRFTEVARAILAERAADFVVIVASESERSQCAPLLELAAREPRVIDLIGRTSVGGLMAAVERAALVIANDSASLHMAVGFDRPIVSLFGPTRVDLVGPYGRERDVLQPAPPPPPGVSHKDAAAGRELMARIPTAQVIDAALERLANSSPHGAAR